MLKACWDCVSGSAANYEGGYGTQLNGGSESVPLRPVRSTDRNMFVIPRALSHGDRLMVSGNFNNPNRFTANFLTGSTNPDYSNIACQLDADFQNNEIALRIIENGQQVSNTNPAPADMISGSPVTLDFKFEGRNGTTLLVVFANDSSVDMLELRHDINRITYLEVKGLNVTELSFKFAE